MYRECLSGYKERHHHYLYGKPRGTKRTPTGGRNDGKARMIEIYEDDNDEQWIRDRLADALPDLPDDECDGADALGGQIGYQSLA